MTTYPQTLLHPPRLKSADATTQTPRFRGATAQLPCHEQSGVNIGKGSMWAVWELLPSQVRFQHAKGKQAVSRS
jgi:hypothetical protein